MGNDGRVFDPPEDSVRGDLVADNVPMARAIECPECHFSWAPGQPERHAEGCLVAGIEAENKIVTCTECNLRWISGEPETHEGTCSKVRPIAAGMAVGKLQATICPECNFGTPAGHDREFHAEGCSMIEAGEINTRFTYHPPTEDQTEKYFVLRDKAKDLAHTIGAFCPDCRERALAITKLEEAVMWANAGIARRS